MPALSPLKQTSSTALIWPSTPSSTTSWEEATSQGAETLQDAAPRPEEVARADEVDQGMESNIVSTLTSGILMPPTTIEWNEFAKTETHQLSERRKLSWNEMLRQTEFSLRQADAFRRTLRELERRNSPTP